MPTLLTTTSVGNREDLINVITNISPEQTPFLSALGKTKATAVNHEWLTDTLSAPADNAVIEGADVVATPTLGVRTRLGNHIQNFQKIGKISDVQEQVNKAGLTSEYAYQLQKATKELARDMERTCWEGVDVAGSGTVAGRMGGVFSFLSTNIVNGGGVASVSATATAGAATSITAAAGHGSTANQDYILITGGTGDGQWRLITAVATNVLTVLAWDVIPDATSAYTIFKAPAALSEVSMNDALQQASDEGGEPKDVFVDGEMKRAISGFNSGLRRMTSGEQTLTNSIDVYESDFGKVAMHYDRWAPAKTVTALDMNTWKLAQFGQTKPEELPRLGTSRRFMINSLVTLEALAENGNAAIFGARK